MSSQVLCPFPINISLPLANTEYEIPLPRNCSCFYLQCRDGTEVRYAFVTGKVAGPTGNYMTLRENSALNAPDKVMVHNDFRTVYVATGGTDKVVECLCFTTTNPNDLIEIETP